MLGFYCDAPEILELLKPNVQKHIELTDESSGFLNRKGFLAASF